MCFVHSKTFSVSASEEEFILKNIFTEENLRKLMSSMSFKNVWAKALAKLFKKIRGFFMLFKFKRSIWRFFKTFVILL